VIKKAIHIKILRSAILVLCLPFLAYYSLFLSQFDDQWLIKLILSFALLYIFTAQKSFVLFNILGAMLAYILYLFVAHYYNSDSIPFIMVEYIEPSAIFANVTFSISLLAVIFLKMTSTYNQMEISKVFANAMAHEVYSPISIVKLKADMMLDKCNDNEEFDVKNEVLELTKITQYCLNNIEIILTASVNIDREYSDTKKYSAASCIELALNEFYLTKEQAEMIHFNKSNDFKFKGSRHLFKHLIFNFMKNTFNHAGSDVKINIWLENNQVHFKDFGIGIKKEDIRKIFNTDFTKGGFGIGMHFCKKVMEKMGGTIQCKSEYGKYMEFILTFPETESEKV
jgi:signal transduction histidine kinase